MSHLHDILRSADTIAVVGISSNPDRISHRVALYLQEAGYRVIPVNPGHETLIGETCYASVTAIPPEIRLDIVDVFRRPEHTAGVVREVAERASKTGNLPVVWTQIGVSSPEARTAAEEAGLPYVADRCTMAEHRLAGI